uniref:Tectonic family member 3 n=1 Tax=Calidris pygmaea TaxID=425635 RepID=A0A8C3JS51_9CHAR
MRPPPPRLPGGGVPQRGGVAMDGARGLLLALLLPQLAAGTPAIPLGTPPGTADTPGTPLGTTGFSRPSGGGRWAGDGPALWRPRQSGAWSVSRVCVEQSLVFRSNTPYPTDTIAVPGGHDLFCVQLDDYCLLSVIFQSLCDFAKFSFQAGDPILIYFDSSSVLSMLRQPIKMGASGLCVDGNPAGFLDSKSTSCTRIFANLSKSCSTDPALNAASYYRDFTVLKVHVPINDIIVSAVAPPGAPHMEHNTCINVVSEVIYEIEFSGTRGIQSVSVRFKVSNVSGNSGSSLQQHFTLHFWVSAPVLSRLLLSLYEGDGSCSQFLRHTAQFARNMRTGCKLSNCSYIQQKLYRALQGMDRAEDLAVIGSAHSTQAEEWTAILIQDCSVQAVNCTSCCMVPVTLEIQILWTKVGLLSNPQAQILGARYFYQCRPLKFPSTSMVLLTTGVTFTDMTEWPEPPRGQPQIHWKLPFDIFFPLKVALNLERKSVVSCDALFQCLLCHVFLHCLNLNGLCCS